MSNDAPDFDNRYQGGASGGSPPVARLRQPVAQCEWRLRRTRRQGV